MTVAGTNLLSRGRMARSPPTENRMRGNGPAWFNWPTLGVSSHERALRVRFCSSRPNPVCQLIEQLCQSRLVRIAGGAVAGGFDPLRVLNAQVFVDLLLQLGVSIDFVRHKVYLAESSGSRGKSFGRTTGFWRQGCGQRNALRKAARICLKRALRLARRIDLRV